MPLGKYHTRLRQHRRADARPPVCYLHYDSLTVSQEDAIAAAYRSGKIPPNAMLVILPEPIPSHEEWARVCGAEYAEREAARLAHQQQSLSPAGSTPGKT